MNNSIFSNRTLPNAARRTRPPGVDGMLTKRTPSIVPSGAFGATTVTSKPAAANDRHSFANMRMSRASELVK